MLLPDISSLVTLLGRQSIGPLLLGPEVRDLEGNGAEYKILREVLRGETVSRNRLEKLQKAIAKHGRDNGVAEKYLSFEIPNISKGDPLMIGPGATDVTLTWWEMVGAIIPREAKQTRRYLTMFINASAFINWADRGGNISDLQEKLPDLPREKFLSPLHYLAAEIDEHNNISRATKEILPILGLITLCTILLAEMTFETPAAHKEAISRLLAEEGGVVRPNLAFAAFLERLRNRDAKLKKMQFIEKAFGDSEAKIREAHKYFGGSKVPTFAEGFKILTLVVGNMSSEELYRRQFGLVLTLLVTNIANHFKDPKQSEQVTQAFQFSFDHLMADLQDRP